jgi:nucleotide-binding universal stress UspA family protein
MAVASRQTEGVKAVTQVFHSILVATDFSQASRRALSSALALASHHDAQASVVHVCGNDRPDEMPDSPSEIGHENADFGPQLPWIKNFEAMGKFDAVLAKRGPVAAGVLSALDETAADLLVLGTRARGGLAKLALGSVAEELVRTATCPVMTVGPNAQITENGQFHTILFATDYGPGSARALPLVAALSDKEKARLVVLHMISPMPATSASLSAYGPAMAGADELLEWEGCSRQRSLEELRAWIGKQSTPHPEPEYIVRIDFWPEGILTAANAAKADLIVMGASRGASPRLAAHLPWTAIHEVIRRSSCPVLTVAG